MLKNIEPSFKAFLENYSGSIKNKFVSEINSGKKLFVFNGPSGCGKDFLTESAAKEFNMELKKLNLYTLDPDQSGNLSNSIYSTIMNMASSNSLFGGGKKIIYVEDLEKVLSVEPSILLRLSSIQEAIIIFESNSGDIFRAKNKKYLSAYSIIRFYRLNERIAKLYLTRLISLNRLSISMQIADSIAKNSKGNLGSIMTDLETMSIAGENARPAPRTAEDSIFETIKAVFSGTADLSSLYFPSDAEAKNMEIWLADKASGAFSKGDLFDFLLVLSNSDIILRKIKKQNWGLMRYVSALFGQGSLGLNRKNPINLSYNAPDWDAYYSNY